MPYAPVGPYSSSHFARWAPGRTCPSIVASLEPAFASTERTLGGIASVVKETCEPVPEAIAFLAIRQAEYSVPGCSPLTDARTSIGSPGRVSCAAGVLDAPAPLQLLPGAYSKYQTVGARSAVSLPSSVTVSVAIVAAG